VTKGMVLSLFLRGFDIGKTRAIPRGSKGLEHTTRRGKKIKEMPFFWRD